MTITYTYTQARQNLAALLEGAARDGEARILRKNGQVFVIRPEAAKDSPLDVEGVDLNVDAAEIVRVVRELRQRGYPAESR